MMLSVITTYSPRVDNSLHGWYLPRSTRALMCPKSSFYKPQILRNPLPKPPPNLTTGPTLCGYQRFSFESPGNDQSSRVLRLKVENSDCRIQLRTK